MYLEVEKELSKLSEEKLDEYSTALEDHQRQLLYPVIERAVENMLNEILTMILNSKCSWRRDLNMQSMPITKLSANSAYQQ